MQRKGKTHRLQFNPGPLRHTSCIGFLSPSGTHFHVSALLELGMITGCRLTTLWVFSPGQACDRNHCSESLWWLSLLYTYNREAEEQTGKKEQSISASSYWGLGTEVLLLSAQASRPPHPHSPSFLQGGSGLQAMDFCEETWVNRKMSLPYYKDAQKQAMDWRGVDLCS